MEDAPFARTRPVSGYEVAEQAKLRSSEQE
jgi:hypothetical protein